MEAEKTVVTAKTLDELKSDLIPDEFNELVKVFKELDIDNDDGLNLEEVTRGLDKMGKTAPEANKIFEELDINKDGKISFIEFGQLYKTLKSSRLKAHKRGSLKAGDASALHTLTDEETGAYAEIINYLLKGEEVVKDIIPIAPANNLYTNVGNGLILCKLINKAVPGTIDERAINKKKPLNTYQIIENLNLAISSASAIGCMTTGIVPQLIVEKKEYLILAMVWQIVKVWATRQIDLKQHPELIRLLHEGEEINTFLRLPPEEILLRWFNYHLAKAGHPRKVANFSTDVKDGENYLVLLHQLDSNKCSKDALSLDAEKRAVKVIENAQKIGVPPVFIPAYITSGNAKLNLLFTASIFNICPGLEATEVEKKQAATLLDDDVGDSREERAFRLWINSFGDEFWVNHLYEDLKDGVKLLKLMDKIQPGCVDWKKVVEKPHNKFQQVGNDNLAVDIGKSLGFSLEGIGGKDILDGNKKLVLALVWQMVRKHTMQVLGGIDEVKLQQWANEKAAKDPKITSFKDASLKTSKFLLNLLDAVSPGCVDWAEVAEGSNPEEIEKNAKYCISTARKIGVMTYVVWEDIKEVKPKMMLLLVAGICTVDKEKGKK